MKFLFDARYIRPDFHDGISRFSAELGTALARITPVTFIICDERQRELLPSGSDCITIHKPTSAREPFTAQLLNRYHPDVVFSPMQTMGSGGRHFKLILTLHDMIYYRHRTPPRDLPAPIRLGWRLFHLSYVPQRATLNAADIVATVSQTSKREFERVNLTRRPILVIPNAPQDLGRFARQVSLAKAPRDLIYMGSFMPYKNVETLLAALQKLPGYRLHLLSKISPIRKAALEQLTPTGADVIFHDGTSDEEYATLLAANGVLVSASLDEGYGLPVAEALALGVPAVVSDIPIFHEVAGEGALYFDPHDPRDLAAQIKRLDDTDLRKSVAAQGKKHIQQFSWEKSARTLLQAAEQLTSSDTIKGNEKRRPSKKETPKHRR